MIMETRERGDHSVTIHQRLKDLREDHDLTQTEAGKIIGISQSDYGKYERGEMMMGIDKYIKFARFYNVSIDYLCGIIDTPRALVWDEARVMQGKGDRALLLAYHSAPVKIRNAIKDLLKGSSTKNAGG